MNHEGHGRPYFFKFAGLEAAARIIDGQSLKWSSAVEFNDPYDHRAGFRLDIDGNAFADLLTASMMRIIFTDVAVGLGASPLFTERLICMRNMRGRLSSEALQADFQTASLQVVRNITEGIASFNEAIHAHLLNSRVLCVTEDVNNVVMWSHYAEQHRGAAFQLGCLPHLDNRLLAAKPVQYTEEFIAFPGAEEYAKHLTGESPVDLVQLVCKIAYTKHRDWAYEREWRVHIPLLDEQPSTNVSIYTEPPEIFQAMYLGCRMPSGEREHLINLARARLPTMKIYQAQLASRSFNLEFVSLDGA